MIVGLLNQTQRLFGRGFLIAGLVPTALACVAIAFLIDGPASIAETANGWFEGAASSAIFELALLIVLLYLFSYVVYGLRSGLQRLFEGEMPAVLNGVRDVLLERSIARYWTGRREQARLLAAVNIDLWIKRGFGAAHVDDQEAIAVPPGELPTRLEQLQARHDVVLDGIRNGPSEERRIAYGGMLADAYVLAALRPVLTDVEQQEAIGALLERVESGWKTLTPGEQRWLQGSLLPVFRRRWATAHVVGVERFPKNEWDVRPTRFGNVLASLADYGRDRYGIDTTVLFPRLQSVMSDTARRSIDDAAIYVDFTLVMSAFSVVVCLVAIGTVPMASRPWFLDITWPLVAVVLALAFSRSAVVAARNLVTQIQTATDLHRLAVLDAMAIRRPATLQVECALWAEIAAFLEEGDVPERTVTLEPRPPNSRSTE